MAPDYIIEEEERKWENQKECNVLYEAAIHISNKSYSRQEAINHVRDVVWQREEAKSDGRHVECDENENVISYLEEGLGYPAMENESQVKAIYHELLEQKGISEEI